MNNNTFYAYQQLDEGASSSRGILPMPTAIPQLLDHVANSLIPIAKRKNQTLHCYADTHLNRCYLIDNIRLSEVINNFISNAIKFTPEYGEIILRAQLIERIDDSERIRFSVKDNGIGIAEDIQHHILMGHTNVGLGLSVCKHLADLLGGYIEFESQRDKGSIFSIIITLPICVNKQVAVNSIVKTENLLTNTVDNPPVYALVADNQSLSRELLAEIIKSQGFVVETATNDGQALSLWKKGRHSIIFTDCQKQQTNGFMLAKEIRCIEHAEHMKACTIVAWTSKLSDEAQLNYLKIGINEFLTKPINIPQLEKILTTHLHADKLSQLQPTIEHNHDLLDKNNSPIDYTILEQVIPNSDRQTEVLHQLQTHVHHDYDELETQVQNANIIGIESVAHRMKGSCKMVGVNRIAKLCEEIENTAKNGNILHAEQTLSILHNSILEFDAFMHHQQVNASKPSPHVGHY